MGYHSYQPGIIGGIVLFDLIVEILAIVGNSLVVIAVVNVKIGLVGFRRFLISLLASNIFLCVTQVLIAAYLEVHGTIDSESSCFSSVLESLKLFAVFAAFFNLCGMSVDHLIGITLPVKYDYLMNTKVAKIAPYFLWMVAFILGFVDILVAALVYHLSDDYGPAATSPDSIFNLFDASSQPSDFVTVTSTQLPVNNFYKKPARQDPFSQLDNLLENNNHINLLLQEETDWCLISHSYKVYWVLWFRLFLTLTVFAFLLFCYGRMFYKIRKLNSVMKLMSPLLLELTKHRDTYRSPVMSRHQRKGSRKFVIATLSLLTVFAVCWLPFIIIEIVILPNMISAAQRDEQTVADLHLLQHVFNSLFLSYPLIDSVICIIRICPIRRYIHLMLLLFPLKCCLPQDPANQHHQAPAQTLASADPLKTDFPPSMMNNKLTSVSSPVKHQRSTNGLQKPTIIVTASSDAAMMVSL